MTIALGEHKFWFSNPWNKRNHEKNYIFSLEKSIQTKSNKKSSISNNKNVVSIFRYCDDRMYHREIKWNIFVIVYKKCEIKQISCRSIWVFLIQKMYISRNTPFSCNIFCGCRCFVHRAKQNDLAHAYIWIYILL